MDLQSVYAQAKKDIGPYCKVCPVCNGRACRGVMPGPGGKGTGSGFTRNYEKLREVLFHMTTVYEGGDVTTETELFGEKMAAPVFAGPVGAVKMHYSDKYDDTTYNIEAVHGCRDAGVLALTGDGIGEAVFQGTLDASMEVDGHSIPTIKPWSEEEVIKKIRMAEKAGVPAVAMDIDAAGLQFLAELGHPVNPKGKEELARIIGATDLPFILKGVMTVEAAKVARDAGAAAILVSNHGGRVLDETLAPIEVLEDIAKAVGDDMTILIDGGFRTGGDVFKALALGAHGVIIARPIVSMIYGGGREAVTLYMNTIRKELADTMIMTGARNLSEITRDKVQVTF